MIYIIYYKTDYIDFIFKGIDKSLPVELIELNIYRSFIHKLLVKIYPASFAGQPTFFFNRKLQHIIGGLKSSDSILLIDYSDVHLLRAIKQSLKEDSRLNYWAWNPVKINGFKFFQTIKLLGFIPFTFEPRDAKKYQIGLLNQFYRMQPDYSASNECKYDFYFIGFIKNRGDKIEKLKSYLIANGYSVLFHVVEKANQIISYDENIKNILSSRCLVDIVEDGLKGITLRPLEALAFNKKLITNNESIMHMDFYNEYNILIYNDDHLNVSDFLTKSNALITKDILEKYDVNNWIKYLLNRQTVS